ncbi:MAG: RNA polymerase sigma factor [Candidatus Aminicenantales bacterium]|jgi:RNA polymerase sigma-70 factor, ECF subfamily
MPTKDESTLFEEMMTYREDVFRICLGFSRNPSDAEDLSQDVYLKAYKNVGKIHTPYAVKEWLFRVTRTTCLDHHKKLRIARLFQQRASNPSGGPGPVTPEYSAEDNERLKALKEAVGRLPKKLREVFVLREYGHASYQELARTLGIKEGTVMSRLSRARRAVANSVKEDLHG